MLKLPTDPTEEQLAVIETYLREQKKIQASKGYGTRNYYEDREELIPKKLIIYKNCQTKSPTWYMRFYAGDRKYKSQSLRTDDKTLARTKALDKWRTLTNHLEGGGQVFETPTNEALDRYHNFLDEQVATNQLKKHTIQAKRTSLKKLRLYLAQYHKPSQIPPMVLDGYVTWRRTKNWDKTKHYNNPKPPSDMTINKELNDFKGFFDWCKKNKKYVQEIEYPFLKIDWSKSVEKNTSFDIEDWRKIVYYLRTWVKKTKTLKGNERKNPFYRKVFAEFLKVLSNSGMRPHEALLLKWSDIEVRVKQELDRGKPRDRFIAHINIHPDTKTGRRLVICPAGVYFKRIKQLYIDEGWRPDGNDYIFRNIGTIHSRADHFVGEPLTSTFFRKLFYEMMEDLRRDKDHEFVNHYTLYSCRSFFINQRLEMGIKPHFVAKLVGHSVKTMERHYENIQLRQLEPELVEVRKKQLSEVDFQTFDMDEMR